MAGDVIDTTTNKGGGSVLVVRSEVPQLKHYSDYRRYLRHDFIYSCAYCTMSEAEAQAIRLTIDHYEPRSARPDLENHYDNLMYCCDECNTRKGDRSPPPSARESGFRFFRPDQDRRDEHFRLHGLRLEAQSNIGHFTIAALDLNRNSLRKLREIRDRLTSCALHASEGVVGLRNLRIDQIPPAIRGRAVQAIKDALAADARIVRQIDELLARFASSPLLDDDDRNDVDRQRVADLKAIEALHPGNWRSTKKKGRTKQK